MGFYIHRYNYYYIKVPRYPHTQVRVLLHKVHMLLHRSTHINIVGSNHNCMYVNYLILYYLMIKLSRWGQDGEEEGSARTLRRVRKESFTVSVFSAVLGKQGKICQLYHPPKVLVFILDVYTLSVSSFVSA